MIETILTQEKELCKIRDTTDRIMAKIYARSAFVAKLSTEEKLLKQLLLMPFPPIEGLLGEAFASHMTRCIYFFLENEEFKRLCNQFFKSTTALIEFKIALLVPLRQTIGSCFATAFLIHLQKTDLLTLASDLAKTFLKSTLVRVIDQKEIRIPLCVKTGKIAAHGTALSSPMMKSYEYTVAALADVQVGFSRWNFHTALGLDHEATGGLGKLIYSIVQKKMDEIQEDRKNLVADIELLEKSLDFDDAAFKAAGSIERMESIKRSAKMKQMFLSQKAGEYDSEGKQMEKLSSLYQFFVDQYIELFPHYFQELYDPEMFAQGDIMEDQKAGFTLVYKHGRSDSKVWTYIQTDKEYIASLREFIVLTENILINLKRREGLEKVIEDIISEILLAVDTKEFMQEQKVRIEKMHQSHLLERGNTSPYAYIAGGNLHSLIKSYYSTSEAIKTEKISAQSAKDLCFSLIEWMKDVKNIDITDFEKDPFKSFIISNQTHAFNFLPGMKHFKESWMDGGNTYSYMRDHFTPGKLVVFADTNWGAKYLAFMIDSNKDYQIVLTDGIDVFSFLNWDHYFIKDATWEICL